MTWTSKHCLSLLGKNPKKESLWFQDKEENLQFSGTSTPYKFSGTSTPTRSCRQTADRLSVSQLKLRLVEYMYPNSFLYLYIIFCICTPPNHTSNNCHLSFCCPRALGIHYQLSQHWPSTSWFPYSTDSCDLDLSIVFHDKYDKWNNTAGKSATPPPTEAPKGLFKFETSGVWKQIGNSKSWSQKEKYFKLIFWKRDQYLSIYILFCVAKDS